MPHYSQPQHDSLHSSWDRRRHMNLLMFDKLSDIEEIYSGMEKPTLQGSRSKASAIMQRNKVAHQSPTKEPEAFAVKPKEFTRPCSQSLTIEALQTLKGGAPSYPASQYAPSEVPSPTNMPQTVGFHEEPQYAPEILYKPQQSQKSSKPTTPQFDNEGHTTYSTSHSQPTSTQRPPPSWLMPWQTGDRVAGRTMADAVRKNRTPCGSFANLDLAKAVK